MRLEPPKWTAEEYHDATEWLGASMLEDFVKSPELFYRKHVAGVVRDNRDSKPLRMGTGLHAALERRDLVIPEFARAKTDKEALAEFEAAAGCEFKSADERRDLICMRASVLSHPMARELLDACPQREQTVLWEDDATGLKCKCRRDYASDKLLVDVKTTREIDDFEREMGKWGYHRKLAHYEASYADVQPIILIIAVENREPWRCRVREVTEPWLEVGRRQRREALADLAACAASGEWHAEGWDEVIPLNDPPRWIV